MSYWEANDLDVCTNQLLIDSFSVSCFTVSAQFLGPWVDWLKIVTDRQTDGDFGFLYKIQYALCGGLEWEGVD